MRNVIYLCLSQIRGTSDLAGYLVVSDDQAGSGSNSILQLQIWILPDSASNSPACIRVGLDLNDSGSCVLPYCRCTIWMCWLWHWQLVFVCLLLQLVGMDQPCYVSEHSVVNPVTCTMHMKSRNVRHARFDLNCT